MCGIVGILGVNKEQVIDCSVLHKMNEAQYHRGPDDSGTHVEPGIGLGHRRLSIIDLVGGHQPLFNEDGSVAVVFNGEIYNFQELVSELTARGHVFRTRTDTEVIAHGWEEWRERCVEHFRGMFAFAVWDRNTRSLFLARDRIGIKPLYYACLTDGTVLFGSELKALLCYPGMPQTLRADAVEDYFAFGYVPDPKTIYQHAFKLPPGHTITFQHGTADSALRQYWDVHFSPSITRACETTLQEVIERLREAVQSHLISDVPLGAFLSGGVDSSAVVATMAGLLSEPVRTASISFGEGDFNEARFAESIARRYGTDHHVQQVNPDDFELIHRLAEIYDEPYADSSAIPTFRVCELARRHVKVALSGDGGDENFAGYRRYRWHMNEQFLRAKVPLGVRQAVFGLLGGVYPKMDWAPRVLRAKSTLESLALSDEDAYFHTVSVTSASQARRLLSRNFRRELNGYRAIEVFRSHLRNAPDHPLSRIQYLDFKTYLPGDILTKVDRASMAHSLEVRVPILDHRFVEWVAALDPDLKLHGREGKYLFKKALEPLLPKDILYRPKMGFGVPLAKWFRGPLKERVRESLLGESLADTRWFDQAYLRRLVDEHESGRRDHSAVIWSLLMFERSLNRTFETSEGFSRSPSTGTGLQGLGVEGDGAPLVKVKR